MTKKYFVRRVFAFTSEEDKERGIDREVTHEEYVRLANRQFMGPETERVLESAKRDSEACGTTHMFWTADE
jgi:hypothetical protein